MLVNNASRALSTSGEDWILFGDNTGILVGDAAGDFFGSSTALSSDGLTLAVSAKRNHDNGRNAGHVKKIKRQATLGLRSVKLLRVNQLMTNLVILCRYRMTAAL